MITPRTPICVFLVLSLVFLVVNVRATNSLGVKQPEEEHYSGYTEDEVQLEWDFFRKKVMNPFKRATRKVMKGAERIAKKTFKDLKKEAKKRFDDAKREAKKKFDEVKEKSSKEISKMIAKKPAVLTQYYLYARNRADWMGRFFNELQSKRLRDLCLPGSHDSGASRPLVKVSPDGLFKRWSVLLRNERKIGKFFLQPWSRSQVLNVYAQLVAGVRYMDLRFCRDGGNFATCHGMYGQSADEVFSQLRRFLDAFRKEVVIIQIRIFDGEWSQNEFDRFFSIAQRYLSGYVNDNWNMDSTLSQIVNGGKRLLVTHYNKRSEINYSKFPGICFDNFDDHWPDKKTASELRKDLKKYMPKANKNKLRIMQYLLTPDPEIIGKSTVYRSYPDSLEELARNINNDVDDFWGLAVRFANVIEVDFVEQTRAVDMSIAISLSRAGTSVPQLQGSKNRVLPYSVNELGPVKRYSSLIVPKNYRVDLQFGNGLWKSYKQWGEAHLPKMRIRQVKVYYKGTQMQ